MGESSMEIWSWRNLLRGPRNHRNRIPRTDFHAEGAASADIVLDYYGRSQGMLTDANQTGFVRGYGDTGLTARTLVVIDQSHAR